MTIGSRMRAAAIVAGVAVLALTGCSTGKSGTAASAGAPKQGTIKIAYLQKQGDQQYFVDEADGAKAEAAKLGGVEVTVVNLGSDANKAISEMDAALARKVDGIAIVVPDQQIGPQIIDAARQGGVPVVASDDSIKAGDGTPAAFVGFDGTQMGQKVGQQAGTLYKQSGWTPADTRIISAWKQDLSVCHDRVEGAAQAFKQAAGADVQIVNVGTDNSNTDAQNKAGAVLTANQGVKHWVVWGCNDENETGVVTALQNNGVKPADIIGVGLGAYLTCKDWKAGQDSGNKAALFISGRSVGASAIDVLVDKIRNGKDLPPKTVASTTMVDKGSWQTAGVVCT